MTPAQKKLYQLQAVRTSFLQPALQSGGGDMVELAPQRLVRLTLIIIQKSMTLREVVDCDGDHHTGGREGQPIGTGTILVPCPLDSKGRLVDVAVYPVAIVEVVGDQMVDNVERWQQVQEVPVPLGHGVR